MVAVPTLTPVTTPPDTVAAADEDDQVPPDDASVNVEAEPTQMEAEAGEMGANAPIIVMTLVAEQPPTV